MKCFILEDGRTNTINWHFTVDTNKLKLVLENTEIQQRVYDGEVEHRRLGRPDGMETSPWTSKTIVTKGRCRLLHKTFASHAHFDFE